MSDPVLLAIAGEASVRQLVEETLGDRYRSSYRVESARSPDEARSLLRGFAEDDLDVALVLVGRSAEHDATRVLLEEARRLHPHARRSLMIGWGEWGDRATGDVIFEAIAEGLVDHYVVQPSEPPDEIFHHAISGMLLDWAESQRVAPNTIHVVGESWSGRAYELRELLGRCAFPHTFSLADSSDGRALLGDAVDPRRRFPLVLLPNGTVLDDPTNAEIVAATGSPVDPPTGDFDLVIVGAGPAGLSAAVYGASEGFSTLVVDLGGIGGQATSSSLIRNYLGFSRGVTGRRLARQAYEQAWVFGAHFTFMQPVVDLRRDADGLVVTLPESGAVRARAVVLATGATYRGLGVPSLDDLNGAGVFYGGTASEAQGMTGRDVYIVGGANSAGQAALHLARYARQVTLVVRGDSLAAGMSHYLVQQVETAPRVRVRLGTEVVGGGGEGHLEQLLLRERATGREDTVGADGLFLLIGAQPHTEWLPDGVQCDGQGFVLTGDDVDPGRWPLTRPRFAQESSMPGVFAVGDVRHGSVKRVASAVGEGSVAIQTLHQFFAREGYEVAGRQTRSPV